jgi:hypothetical protein
MAKQEQYVIKLPLQHVSIAVWDPSIVRAGQSSTTTWKQCGSVSVRRIQMTLWLRASQNKRKVRITFLLDTGSGLSGVRADDARRLIGTVKFKPGKSNLTEWAIVNGVFGEFHAPLHRFFWSLSEDSSADEFNSQFFIIPPWKERSTRLEAVKEYLKALVGWDNGEEPLSLLSLQDLVRFFDITIDPSEIVLTRRSRPSVTVN